MFNLPFLVEDCINPHSAAATGLLVRINRKQRFVDLDTGEAFRNYGCGQLLEDGSAFAFCNSCHDL